MKLSRKILRKNILEQLIIENKREILKERKKLKLVIKNKEEYIYSRDVLYEGLMDDLGDIGGGLLKTLGGDIDSIKSYFIGELLEKLGIDDPKTKGMISNIIEQVGMDDLIGFMTGTIDCETLTEDIVKGLVEFAIEDGMS